MRVLISCGDAKDGTAYYRGVNPFSRIKDVQLVYRNETMSWNTLADIDVVFYQRPASQFDVAQLDYAKSCGKPILVDYDDDAFSVPPSNLAHEFYSRDDKQACIKAILSIADIVMVSTPGLKEALLEQVPTANIRVVPNALDDLTFETEPSTHTPEKVILMRGASGHEDDWTPYSATILDLLKTHPDYKLAVMGYTPPWLSEIPDSQLRVYQFASIPAYFDILMQIRPAIMIVPLQFNKFNVSKSNVAAIEGSIAGAAVVASDLPEFKNMGILTFHDGETLKWRVELLMEDEEIRDFYYRVGLEASPKLSEVNEIRRDILEELLTLKKKKKPLNLKPQPATHKEFYEYALSRGHCQDNPVYAGGHKQAAKWIVEHINPRSVVEYGCGPGATLKELLNLGVMAYGLEINPYFVQYFKDNHPMFAGQVSEFDFTKQTLETDAKVDLGISLEVFEHISMTEEWWDEFIQDLSNKYRKFYFSSTPFHDLEHFDLWWGHCNIRKTSSWIDLFTRNGWKYDGNPKIMTSWDLLFSSKN